MASPVLGATATEAALDADDLNPTRTDNRAVVHVTLVFDGVNFVANDLYDALNAQYGTVGYEKNTAARGTYIFNIAA